jgi:ketosteroid isomerase-like protein
MMVTESFAKDFATAWAASWNSHDLDDILSHYSEDFSIETPMALKLVPESGGKIHGKSNVKAYWEIGLQRIPDLHFEILDVLTGINSMTIYYLNTATGRKSAENLFFNPDMKVSRAFVMYS